MTAARALMRSLAALTLVGATACGIPLDDEPRALATTTTTQAADTTTSTAAAAADGNSRVSAFVFFVADNQLVNLEVDVPGTSTADALGVLFAGTPTGVGKDVVSQIPNATRLLGVRQIGTTAVVDVSSQFDNLVGTGRTQATAQIVMTATDLPDVEQVAIRIEGQPTQVFSPVRGDTDQVGACDYVGLLPAEDVPATWPIDRRARQHLVTRRNMLLAQCPAQPSDG